MPVLKPVLIPSPGAVGASRSFAALKDEDSK